MSLLLALTEAPPDPEETPGGGAGVLRSDSKAVDRIAAANNLCAIQIILSIAASQWME